MPKISGSNIVEHVIEQEAAVFDAATRLFAERGINNVSMTTIAEAVGLARPSLYRYFPTKSAIVFRWFNQVMTPLIADSEAIAESEQEPAVRFDRWVTCQIDFLTDGSNQAMIKASVESSELSDEERRVIGARHRDLYASLKRILTESTPSANDETLQARVLLIVALLRGLPDLVTAGVGIERARSELMRAARLITPQ